MPEETPEETLPETQPALADTEPAPAPDLRPTPPPEGVRPQDWREQQLAPHRRQFA